jgi:hypothetical protein
MQSHIIVPILATDEEFQVSVGLLPRATPTPARLDALCMRPVSPTMMPPANCELR